jgi:hypothetical protein
MPLILPVEALGPEVIAETLDLVRQIPESDFRQRERGWLSSFSSPAHEAVEKLFTIQSAGKDPEELATPVRVGAYLGSFTLRRVAETNGFDIEAVTANHDRLFNHKKLVYLGPLAVKEKVGVEGVTANLTPDFGEPMAEALSQMNNDNSRTMFAVMLLLSLHGEDAQDTVARDYLADKTAKEMGHMVPRRTRSRQRGL